MRRVLDTSILISHWRRCRSARPLAQINETEAQSWALRLIEIERSDAIVTPVLLEFLCGVVGKRDITLAPKKLIRTRRASEGSASEPSLARRVSMCKDAKLSCRGNSSPPPALGIKGVRVQPSRVGKACRTRRLPPGAWNSPAQ